ncbi:flavin reductase family protein [Adlercreutzia equolifaciens]|uniref:flavin reductase family protein n=1 Tax=Adlercreutzia equolifaciens TaxID=446660 RepID=UPI003AAAD98C
MPDPVSIEQPRASEAPPRALSGRAIAAALGPRPVIVVGTVRNGRANFAPAAFCTPLSYDPPLVALGLKPTSWSCQVIEATGCCTLSTVDAEAAGAVLWCGSRSGRDADKSAGFPCAWTSEAMGASLPYPADALTVLKAELVSASDAGDHRLLILKIASAATRLPETDGGRLATEPTLLCLEHGDFALTSQIP